MKKLLTLFFAMIASTVLMAQVTTSSINGKITDNKKEALLGATIVATHTPSGTKYYAVADNNGIYNFLNIRSGGPYKMEVKMMGFQDIVKDNITVALGENLTLNFVMTDKIVGLEEVTISAQAQSNTHIGTTTRINSEQIAALPTISRNLNDVLSLTPQASITSNGLAIGGGNFRQSYVTVDGAAFHNAYGIGSNLPAGGTPITLDALESVNISIAPHDVRQSGFTGGSVNAVTKSGTNQLHASVYDYFTSDGLVGTRFGHKDDNGRYPDNLLFGQSLLNTTGISIGGPVVKNKLFYFINFEYETDIAAGQMRYARQTEMSEWGGNTQYNRPTVAKMNEIREYLINTYGYDPGKYQDYSFSTPDYKLMARMDWNINDNNRFNIRYSMVKHQFFSAPSNSITPLSSSLYNKNVYGRGSIYSMYFESSNYIQQQNFSSVASELNSRFLNGRLTNTLRAVYSNQHEPRKMTRDVFPTVDILETLDDGTKAVYTSFGPDPFTYGTGSTVHSFIATDELSYSTGIHHIVGGLQFEFDKTINRFMQGGAGYYVYNSWDDFVNQATPAAFTIAYGNNENHEQVATSFNFFQNSLYAQDEMRLSEKFKLTAGLRVEMPYYPSIDYNINKEFQNGWDEILYDTLGNQIGTQHHAIADGDNSLSDHSTADMPKARVDYSPRLGFEWDVTGDKKLVLHGGTGLYTGRLPLVWIVTTVCNSNVAQGTYLTYNKPMAFYSSVDSIIVHNSDKLKIGDLPASQIATILDKNLRMPQTWKSSLALDAKLPGGINASLEGVFGKDLSSVTVNCLGLFQDDSIQLPGEPLKRAHWKSEGLVNSIGGAITPFYITNSKENGFYYSATGLLSKEFDFGLSLMAAYTYSCGKNVTDGIGDQVMSSYTNNTFGVHGSNSNEVGYSSYVSPNRVLLNAGWTWSVGKHTSEMLSCYYEGYNLCYVGSYSYSRYSYTMTGNVNGDFGAHSLAYIPSHDDLYAQDANGDYIMPFVSEENRDAFESFIKSDSYLNSHRGAYAVRGGVIAPWRHTVNLKYERTYKFDNGQALSFGVDVKNIGNLLYRGWGNVKQLSSSDIIAWSNGKYQFIQPVWNDCADVISTWSAALNLRFSF
jgi:hypothetical protein